MTAGRHLVVVAGADPPTTDALADVLRDRCAVRTAYDAAEVLDRLDPEVDVVLIDPALDDGVPERILTTLADRGLDCQVGLLADDHARGSAGADAVVESTGDAAQIRETVDWLATRASYRKRLDEYYELAREYADARETADGPPATAEPERLERLEAHLDRLRDRLDEAQAAVDVTTLFETALDRRDDR